MSRVDELVQKICPGGVEFREIDQTIHLNFGTRITKLQSSGSVYPVYGGGGESFRTDDYNRENEYVISRFAMSKTCVRKVRGKFWMLDSGFTFDPVSTDIDKDYVAYVLFNLQPTIYSCSSQGAQKNLKVDEFRKFRIPVPPLEVQRAIVGILDNFTKLEAELEAELEARKKQYVYYRDQLLSRSESFQRVALGNIVSILNGYPFKSNQYVDSGVRIIRIGDVQKGYIAKENIRYQVMSSEAQSSVLMPDDVVMSLTGNAGRVAMISIDDLPAALNQRVACLRPKSSNSLLPRYLFHYLNRDSFESAAMSNASGAAQKNLSIRWLAEQTIPLPPLKEQRRIVTILDHFDSLVNDIFVGLPAELAARRRQYEHYRDKLLTFKEAA